ncbi:MAG: DUF2142 domain-containing protein [Acidimicrobiaceae bacterium]|nr:DUF2142 domain-containing protein [Acidimicrobiaceae bacterium]
MNWREKGIASSKVLITPRNAFVIILVLAFASLASWSFASPLVASPDEQAHLLRAYALDHGQLGSATTPPSKVNENVVVPTSLYYSAIYPICWQMKEQIPATCSKPWPTSSAPQTISIYVDHYPPLYYLFVGTATYISHQVSGIYMMRLISSLMGALMLAIAAYAIARWSKRRALFLGIYIALVPEAYFLSSSVNPSGFEIMTSICLWTLVAIFALEQRDDPPHQLVVLLASIACIDVLIRGLSPLWVALAGLTLIFLSGPRKLFELFKRRRDLQIAAGGVVVAALLAALWIFTQGTLNILPVGAAVPKNDSTLAVLHIVAASIQGWLREMIGILGWLDTPLPNIVYQSWNTIVIGALVLALVRGNWRERTTVVALSALTILIPLGLVTRQAKILGVVWQGRDGMPLAVGAVIMAVAVLGAPPRRRARRAVERISRATRQLISRYTLIGVVAVLGLANMYSFYINLRRYAVGRYGPRFFFLHSQGWSPPTGQLLTLVVYALATTALAGVLMVWLWHSPSPDETP